MRAVVQRVSRASVRRAETGEEASIGHGLVVLLGVGVDDDETDAEYLARKIAGLRIFPDDAGQMNRSLLETGGEVLSVSQFTLYGDVRRGRRPSFVQAAPPERANPLYEHFNAALRAQGIPVKTGWFQQQMTVALHNEGPVTLLLDSRRQF